MDYYEILLLLTTVDEKSNGKDENFDDSLKHVLQKVQSLSAECDNQFTIGGDKSINTVDIRYQYISAVVSTLKKMKATEDTSSESLFSVKQFQTLKIAVELVTAIGIVPSLLPGVGINMAKLCPRTSYICEEKVTDFQKYQRLKFTVHSLIDLYNETVFRPVILSQIGVLFTGLLQLCHAPLTKPSRECTLTVEENIKETIFKMTPELYNKLKKDQEEFTHLLHYLLTNCPMSTSMKELMVILGIQQAPKWLQRATRKHLVRQMMQPNGVISIVTAACDNMLDLGEDWNKLDTISRLIATSHGDNPDEYYKSICLQLVDLLESKQVKHASTIANCCIFALYEYNKTICYKNIIEVICEPLLVNSTSEKTMIKSEIEVERCIENMIKCFITAEAKFKHLPCEVLVKVAAPIMCLYNNTRQGLCVLKPKVKQLLLRLLHEESLRENLFAVFLGHDLSGNFGYYLMLRFGPTGGIEISGIDENPNFEEFADSLFDIVSASGVLSTALFSYLLKYLLSIMKIHNEKTTRPSLKSEHDEIENMGIQLITLKMLSRLASTSIVQEMQVKHPEFLFNFIKTLLNKYIKEEDNLSEDDCEILYISLMLVKIILSEKKNPLNWTKYSELVQFLKECCSSPSISEQLLLLIRELIDLIETQGRSERKNYQDLSVDSKTSNKFEEAIKDLADPLLPVRAHGLITLTKLIEQKDPCTTARKAIVLEIFKQNLKHDDSFIYLAAINGLCALATSYPQVIIELLVREFIEMPQHTPSGEITVETRVKLGEILVKITRALGEMASAYKNVLINGFLCCTRDSDSMVRASSLSCLGELCKVLGFRLGNMAIEVIYCISCIIKTDKAAECRRAAVMVSTLLLRGLGKYTLTSFSKELLELYRGLKYLRDTDEDPVLRLHAQLSLEELDCIVQDFVFSPAKLEKRIFLLGAP